jgi:hypothetical protein
MVRCIGAFDAELGAWSHRRARRAGDDAPQRRLGLRLQRRLPAIGRGRAVVVGWSFSPMLASALMALSPVSVVVSSLVQPAAPPPS